jgi:kumamolisin
MIQRSGLRDGAPRPARRAHDVCAAAIALALLGGTCASAAEERFDPPRAALAGFVRTSPLHLDAAPRIHLAIELRPKDARLDALAVSISDPASPLHRRPLGEDAFIARFGRSQADVDALAALLRANGATGVYVSVNRLVVGGDLSLDQTEKALRAHFDLFERGERRIVAPTGPVTLPVSGIRSVRGLIAAFTPRLADVPTLPNDFRGAWFTPVQFRDAYDALPDGGAGAHIVLIEDASDGFDLADLAPFMTGAGAAPDTLFMAPGVPAPPLANSFGSAFGADASRVRAQVVSPAEPDQACGRDDRGQEAALDVDAALTLAPRAAIDVRYDRVCVRGGEGTLAVQRALDARPAPDLIVFPFAVGPVFGPAGETWGPTSIAYLEAAVRGIPVVVPAGDDGALGFRQTGVVAPGVSYPCVLPIVICAGGTQLGLRVGAFDEGPWNDGTHATGGGISSDPRPPWQRAPEAFEFSPAFVSRRIVPDLAADGSGHLEIFWRGYGLGGIGGTSESAALVGAQIAAINAAVAADRRITGPGDLYALAAAHPDAFRQVTGDNDRGYRDNTIRPRPLPPPLGFRGVLPPPPPQVHGCVNVQPRGCEVRSGYNAVTGLGTLRERAAVAALRQ